MLFSNEAVAGLINEQFEPVWVSLRPVPRITIDFGNGNVVRRTLHGNIATWVCAADGTALDVLPGIYETETFLDSLGKLQALHLDFAAQTNNIDRESFLSRYHRMHSVTSASATISQPAALAGIPGLREDTNLNETVRRVAIHKHLTQQGLVQPDQVTKWLYREILNADLDDPYLGLGDKLFGDYPFSEEDASLARTGR